LNQWNECNDVSKQENGDITDFATTEISDVPICPFSPESLRISDVPNLSARPRFHSTAAPHYQPRQRRQNVATGDSPWIQKQSKTFF
jgi:hypothetical protein